MGAYLLIDNSEVNRSVHIGVVLHPRNKPLYVCIKAKYWEVLASLDIQQDWSNML